MYKSFVPRIDQSFFLEKKKSETKPAGVGTGGMLKPGQLLVCFSSCLHFCREPFPPRGDTNVLVVESELGLFRRATLLPLTWPLSCMGWWGNESVCVCVCARALVCPVKRAFRWRNAASDMFGYLWRSWQTWTSSLAGRKKDCLFPKYQRKAWCRWGLHQWNAVGSRSCRCCPWPRTCTSWVGRWRKRAANPHIEPHCCPRGEWKRCFSAVDGSGWFATEDKKSPIKFHLHSPISLGLLVTRFNCAGAPWAVWYHSFRGRLYLEVTLVCPGDVVIFCVADNVLLWRYEADGSATCSPELNSVCIVGE